MALREIRVQGDTVLGKVCKPITEVTPKIVDLIDDMIETMYEANGVGLAAPQVTYIMHDLLEAGIPVDTHATTIAEAKAAILKAFNMEAK